MPFEFYTFVDVFAREHSDSGSKRWLACFSKNNVDRGRAPIPIGHSDGLVLQTLYSLEDSAVTIKFEDKTPVFNCASEEHAIDGHQCYRVRSQPDTRKEEDYLNNLPAPLDQILEVRLTREALI